MYDDKDLESINKLDDAVAAYNRSVKWENQIIWSLCLGHDPTFTKGFSYVLLWKTNDKENPKADMLYQGLWYRAIEYLENGLCIKGE